MIPRLLELIARAGARGDLVAKQDETLVLELVDGALARSAVLRERGVNVRVLREGRSGVAGTTDDDAEAVVASALEASEHGPPAEVDLPEARPHPRVLTRVPRAAAVAADELRFLGQMVADRLAADGRRVAVAVERGVGAVRVANSVGLDAGYETSLVAVLAEVTLRNGLAVRAHLAGADLPEGESLERLVEGMRRQLTWSQAESVAPRGHLPVCLLPGAAAALVAPVRTALVGRSALQGTSPVATRIGERAFDPGLTLIDDPTLDARPGSRPLDDEGVPSARTVVVESGVVRGLLYDLESATRAGTRTTGHARRSTFGKPQTAWSNVVVEPGPHSFEALLGMIDDGLLVGALEREGSVGPAGGFTLSVALGWRVVKGEVVGRVKGAVIAGNAYELLARLRGIGRTAEWRGSQCLPPMVAEGVAVVSGA
ncbi:MAG TPA: TldD/PmbA family protein [Gemmatimonadales bacterium]|nr:TldD/PmbA family protein [Gemmatimonadales bacterium]